MPTSPTPFSDGFSSTTTTVSWAADTEPKDPGPKAKGTKTKAKKDQPWLDVEKPAETLPPFLVYCRENKIDGLQMLKEWTFRVASSMSKAQFKAEIRPLLINGFVDRAYGYLPDHGDLLLIDDVLTTEIHKPILVQRTFSVFHSDVDRFFENLPYTDMWSLFYSPWIRTGQCCICFHSVAHPVRLIGQKMTNHMDPVFRFRTTFQDPQQYNRLLQYWEKLYDIKKGSTGRVGPGHRTFFCLPTICKACPLQCQLCEEKVYTEVVNPEVLDTMQKEQRCPGCVGKNLTKFTPPRINTQAVEKMFAALKTFSGR